MNTGSDVGRHHHLSMTCCFLSERRIQFTTHRRRSNTFTSTRAQRQEQPVTRKNVKKKLQVRNRFEVLRTDDEELPISDEYDDDMKISRAVSKANSDEEMIQTEDILAGVEDPGSEETKTVKMKKTPKQPLTT